jgi:Zn-dependent protease
MSWKVGRVSGIDLYLHPTLLLLLLLPGVYSGGISGLLLTASVFGCVILHELGHALMARRFGIETADITLYPIGGVARLRRMPRAPGAELLIALAGPAVNVAIALGLQGLAFAGVMFGLITDPSLLELANVLTLVNLVLAGFNLIPAFPMDGGRVLRALLSTWLGRARATNVAATIGQVLAVCFGVYSLIHGNLFQAFLAMFIYMAAGAELSSVLAEERRREHGSSEGIWMAPAGFHWVSRGNGIWQLAPIVAGYDDQRRRPWR